MAHPTVLVRQPAERVVIVDQQQVWLLPGCPCVFEGYHKTASRDNVVKGEIDRVVNRLALCPFFQTIDNVRWKLCIDPLPGGRDTAPEDEVS